MCSHVVPNLQMFCTARCSIEWTAAQATDVGPVHVIAAQAFDNTSTTRLRIKSRGVHRKWRTVQLSDGVSGIRVFTAPMTCEWVEAVVSLSLYKQTKTGSIKLFSFDQLREVTGDSGIHVSSTRGAYRTPYTQHYAILNLCFGL